MDKIKTSNFTSTTLAAVSIDTLKNTPIWKKHVNEKGVIIPVKNAQGYEYTAREEDLVRAALHSLGYDDQAEGTYTKRPGTYVVRSSQDGTKGVVTQIYDFRVKKNHSMESFFMRNSFVHIDSKQSNEFVNLAEHGLEYYEINPRKSDKRVQDNDLTLQVADSSESFPDVA